MADIDSPDFGVAVKELASDGFGSHAGRSKLGTALFDVTDLIEFLSQIGHVTGIQRVQIALLREAFDAARFVPPGEVRSFFVQAFCLHGPWGYGTRVVDSAHLRKLFVLLEDEEIDHERLRGIVDDIYETAQQSRLGKGSILVLCGAFWNYPFYVSEIARVVHRGGKIVLICYDVIPIEAPEYCVAPLVQSFRAAFERLAPYVSVFACISGHTASSVRRQLEQIELPGPARVEVLALAHKISDVSYSKEEVARTLAHLRASQPEFPNRRFALCVGTIEARKNLGYLVDAWKELRSRYGAAVPDLVLAGRPGWNVDNLLQVISVRNTTEKHIYILHGLSDLALRALYGACAFTVFPSLLEGWGLPVGEALSEGKICFASSSSSIPEVGGAFADYIDPLNVRDAVEKIGAYVAEPSRITAREKVISDGFHPRDWRDVWKDFARIVEKSAADAGHDGNGRLVTVPEAEYCRVVTDAARFPTPQSLVLQDNWNEVEDWGAWSSAKEATMEFSTGDDALAQAEVDLLLQNTPWSDGIGFEVRDAGGSGTLLRQGTLSREPQWYRVVAPVHGGTVALRLSLTTPVALNNEMDRRALGIGLIAYCWIREGNLASRMKALETRLLGPKLWRG